MSENKVELLGYYGSDEIIACSAWTSTSRDLSEDKKNRIPALINMLWRDGHETPFEKGMVHFLVDTEIASHIHLLKHRLSSMNAESARYKELKDDKFYMPQDWNDIYPSKDIGPEDFPWATTEQSWTDILEEYTNIGNDLYHQCLKDLEPILGRKRAKESARFFKTYNSQIQADVSFNMRSFANFLKLRNSEHAQKEIREIAEEMLRLVSEIEGNPFEHTLASWKNNKS
jgi:thymidylate synthase (FAD)